MQLNEEQVPEQRRDYIPPPMTQRPCVYYSLTLTLLFGVHLVHINLAKTHNKTFQLL